jgi:hypothetical protein
VCGKSCVDECAAGERSCAGPGGVMVCSRENGCGAWSPPVACAAGEVCSQGTCSTKCQDECTDGEVRCMGPGTETCGDLDGDGCREWGPMVPCAAGQSCSQGACVTGCSDECSAGQMSCEGLSLRTCGHYALDSCLHWSAGVSCASGDPCVASMCTPTGCQTAPKVCQQPPPSQCINASTLRVYDAQGACASGTCGYSSHDVACPNCPSCDACAGVTCNAPPNGCFAATGTCTNGACSYGYADGAACDDGNACTMNDSCNSGVCAGTPISCTTPPSPTCTTSTTLRTFSAAGSCSGGTCSYPSTDMTCANGCQTGACIASSPSDMGCVPSGGDCTYNDSVCCSRYCIFTTNKCK